MIDTILQLVWYQVNIDETLYISTLDEVNVGRRIKNAPGFAKCSEGVGGNVVFGSRCVCEQKVWIFEPPIEARAAF